MRKAQPGLRPNRSDAVRALLNKALASEGLLPPSRPPQQA
jgi:Arc/MetJ-type ribon-helix-helix transcriptional regulator